MKIIILGPTGILGKTLSLYLKSKKIDFICISRKKRGNYVYFKDFNNLTKLKKKIMALNPSHIVNCLGVTKFNSSYNLTEQTKFMNTKLPRVLSKFCQKKKKLFYPY